MNIINLRKTWEKLLLAARAIAAVNNFSHNLCFQFLAQNWMLKCSNTQLAFKQLFCVRLRIPWMFTLSPADLKLRGLFSNLQGWLVSCKGKILFMSFCILYNLNPPPFHFIMGKIGPQFSHLLTVRAKRLAPPTPLTVSLTVKRQFFFDDFP